MERYVDHIAATFGTGPGQKPGYDGHEEIEIALLEDILSIVLEEWCGQWKGEQELHPQMIGHENNGRFLQTSPRDAIVLAINLEINFGD